MYFNREKKLNRNSNGPSIDASGKDVSGIDVPQNEGPGKDGNENDSPGNSTPESGGDTTDGATFTTISNPILFISLFAASIKLF